MSHLVAPAIFCFEDMQSYDEITFYLLRAIMKNFSRIYLLGLVRDQNSDPSDRDDVFSIGIEDLSNAIDSNKFHMTVIQNLKHSDDLDEFG